MKTIIFPSLLTLLYFLTSCTQSQGQSLFKTEANIGDSSNIEVDSFPIHSRLTQKASELKSYLKSHTSYNQKLVILIDMRQNSGKNRLFVYDLDSMKILSKSLVAHGSGSETGDEDSLIFSNVPNSYCSSLGKYKIGNAYIGSFGRSYKLHGLDASNNKALERFVVLHRYSCVPDEEQEHEICNSLGCPMVSENYFLILDKYISSSNKSILMEIYY